MNHPWQQPIRPLEVQALGENDWHQVLVFRLEPTDYYATQNIADATPLHDTSWIQWQAITVDGRVFTSENDEMRFV